MTEEYYAAQGSALQPETGVVAERVRRAIGALREALEELESALAAGPAAADGQQATLVEAPPAAASEPMQPAPADQAWAAWSRPVDTLPGGIWAASPAPETPSAFGAAPEAPGPDEDPREQVRRAVESIRAEMEAGVPPVGPESEPAWGVPANEQAAPKPTGPESPSPEELDPREQVRRAVEQLKAELGGDVRDEPRLSWPGVQQEAAAEPAGPFAPDGSRAPNYANLIDERLLQPALIVIDDPEGRVELVRVYRTLARLRCAATANLANYSSHSVTVQLEERKVPDAGEIRDAVTYAFERECEVEVDGNRASIRLAGGKTRAA